MKIIPVPVRDDNYAYLVLDSSPNGKGKGVFVDPYTLSKVQAAAKEHSVEDVVAYPSAPIYGGSDKIPNLTHPVKDGSKFPLFEGSSITVTCHATPCHTQDSIAFFLEDERAEAGSKADGEVKRGVFTGDTLFVSGCGRFFEGEPHEMDTALNKVLASLPGDTLVYCGHEYTKSNVAFSLGVLPDRPAIKALADFVKTGKNGGVTTGVFTIDDERAHNVFMLVRDPEVAERVGLEKGADPIEVMKRLREAKNEGRLTASL
ncbi:Cytoplasmic glyoxalase II [Tilletia horrida]|uniref:hydroxyacylglutathione hydrolase n=1 Tax=Tilletia horrida TaxID=155126 RepID=A0AAN6GRZ8_9BASI|nr:Cytoplasmic glyoxalase II [Tilletia horrida]KAK0565459.1 Cytoplasmic glyoxalase II [Tilletia horrida]